MTGPTPDTRRAELDRARAKAATYYDTLMDELDHDGHDEDCVLRCLLKECEQTHSCDQCREDGEV